MARYRASIETRWTPEAAFTYLSDFSTSAEWDPGVVEAHRVGTGAPGEGSGFRLVVKSLGRTTTLTYRCTEYEPPRAVTFVGENATVVSHDRITFAATLTGTRLTYDADLRLKGLLRIADPLLGLAFRRIGHRALNGLRAVLERPAPEAVDAAA
jgi:carbon monoxide dehydrogenase subunit G